MSSGLQREVRCCLLCGFRLGDDQPAGVYVCDPCRHDRRSYEPAADPVFDRILEELFLMHPGEVVHPLAMLGVSPRFKWQVRSAVRRLRRRRMVIEGVPYRGGYVYRPDAGTLPLG